MKNSTLEYIDPTDLIVAIPKATMDRLLKTEHPGDSLALYSFYCYTGKWQKTNQPKCTVKYIAKGMKWSVEKVRKIKAILKTLSLIEDYPQKTNGKITNWYTKITYIMGSHPTEFPEGGNDHTVDFATTNALSTINLNALSTGKERDGRVLPATSGEVSDFDQKEKLSTEEAFRLNNNEPEEKIDSKNLWIKEIAEDAKGRAAMDKATQPFNIPRDDSTAYLKKINQYVSEIQNGNFLEKNKFSENFLKHTDVQKAMELRGLSEEAVIEKIKLSVDRYLTARHNPDRFDFIARDRKINLAMFLYENNEKTGVLGESQFLRYLEKEPEEKRGDEHYERMLSAVYKNNLPKMYKAVYNEYESFSDEEHLRMIKSILSLCRWWKRNESRLIKVYRGKITILFPKGIESFIEYYFAGFIRDNKFNHAIGVFPEKKYWKAFCDWLYDSYGIDLEAEMVEVKEKVKADISHEEIVRRMEAE